MRRGGQHGYTYLLVLFLVAGLGLLMAGLGQTWQARAQREKEAELIAIGVEMARALGSYHDRSPGAKEWPRSLEDLVEDRRFPTPRRHLRRIYRDPITRTTDWGLVRQAGRIVGIHSMSPLMPFRFSELPPELDESAASATSYRGWVFKPVQDGSARPVMQAAGPD